MSKKVFALISAITTAVTTAAIAWVTYYEPANATVINSAIGIIAGAITQVCNLFVKDTAKETVQESE